MKSFRLEIFLASLALFLTLASGVLIQMTLQIRDMRQAEMQAGVLMGGVLEELEGFFEGETASHVAAAARMADLAQKKQKRLFVQTFGNFELFVDGKPIAFKYTKTKEIVAVLVNNRGAQTTNGEIIACLWEDDGDPEKKASYLSNLRQDLNNTFTRLKLNGLIRKQRGSLAIAADRIECDLYDWLENGQESRYRYLGDYMNQYSWPEVMHAQLDEISWSWEDA